MASTNRQELEDAISNREYVKQICEGRIDDWKYGKCTMFKVGLKHQKVDLHEHKKIDDLHIVVIKILNKLNVDPEDELNSSLRFRDKISKVLIMMEEQLEEFS